MNVVKIVIWRLLLNMYRDFYTYYSSKDCTGHTEEIIYTPNANSEELITDKDADEY